VGNRRGKFVKFPTKTRERKLFSQGYRVVVGIDEVGMGCLAGPVVICALSIMPDFFKRKYPRLSGIRDSKMLNASYRERLAKELIDNEHLVHAISIIEPSEIDQLNIYHAAREGMRRVVTALCLSDKDQPFILIDGNGRVDGLGFPYVTIVKGDAKVFAIAAASIIAKVHRDELMKQYAHQYPHYGFEVHKGYATARHRTALSQWGPSPLHRKSFNLTFLKDNEK
jgi:ribonuclease HII